MGKIAVGIVGVGNCASSLVQGLEFYRVSSQESTRVPVGLGECRVESLATLGEVGVQVEEPAERAR